MLMLQSAFYPFWFTRSKGIAGCFSDLSQLKSTKQQPLATTDLYLISSHSLRYSSQWGPHILLVCQTTSRRRRGSGVGWRTKGELGEREWSVTSITALATLCFPMLPHIDPQGQRSMVAVWVFVYWWMYLWICMYLREGNKEGRIKHYRVALVATTTSSGL